MESLWADAQSLFETARLTADTGAPDCDLAILVNGRGGIQVVEAAGWMLPSLAAHHGARAAYRITRTPGQIQVEGRAGAVACLLRTESPAAASRHLLNACAPVYQSGPRLLAEVPK